MQTIAQSRIKAAFSALVETLNPKKHRISSIVHAKAHRIGPQRVILKIALNDNFN